MKLTPMGKKLVASLWLTSAQLWLTQLLIQLIQLNNKLVAEKHRNASKLWLLTYG